MSPQLQSASGLYLSRPLLSSSARSTSGTSARAPDCSRRRPVTQAFLPASARASGAILRMPQQALRNSMLRYMASAPSRCTNCTTCSFDGWYTVSGACGRVACCAFSCSSSASVSACSAPVSSTKISIGSAWALIRCVMTMSSAPRLLAWVTGPVAAALSSVTTVSRSLASKLADGCAYSAMAEAAAAPGRGVKAFMRPPARHRARTAGAAAMHRPGRRRCSARTGARPPPRRRRVRARRW